MFAGYSSTRVTNCSRLLETGVGVWQDYMLVRHSFGSFSTIQEKTNCVAKITPGTERYMRNSEKVNVELKM